MKNLYDFHKDVLRDIGDGKSQSDSMYETSILLDCECHICHSHNVYLATTAYYREWALHIGKKYHCKSCGSAVLYRNTYDYNTKMLVQSYLPFSIIADTCFMKKSFREVFENGNCFCGINFECVFSYTPIHQHHFVPVGNHSICVICGEWK